MRIPQHPEAKISSRVVITLAFIAWITAATGAPRESILRAQAGPKKAFTTVSVTRSDEFINPNPSVGNGRFVWRAAPLILVIGYAYDASKATIEGRIPVEPTYDISATFPASATTREVQEMVKNLLADKFALRVRTESRTMSLFRLVQEAGGHTLKPAANKGADSQGIRVGHGRFVGSGVTLPQIARALASSLNQPVVDASEINGAFDIDLEDTANPRASAPVFLQGVPRQLGLKLEPATGKVDVLIVDGFKMPK